MKNVTPNWQSYLFVSLSIVAFLFIAQFEVAAQDIYKVQFKAGDRVEADVNMSSSPDSDYATWRKSTVVKVEMWQGLVAGYHIKTDDGKELVIAAKYMRPLSEAQKKEGDKQARHQPKDGDADSDRPVGAGTGTPEQSDCPMEVPPGKVTKTARASAQLFKRVIYEWEAAKINPASISAPQKIGLTFLKFEMGAPYKNTLTSSRFGDKRRHDGAPVGAMIYPIKTSELQCDLHGSSVKRWVTENEGACFKNRFGDWTCPRRTTKFVENRLIPIK